MARLSWEDTCAESRTDARARDVFIVLRVRGIDVSDAVRERSLAQKDMEQLERWLEKASVATSIGEVIDDGRDAPDLGGVLVDGAVGGEPVAAGGVEDGGVDPAGGPRCRH